MSENNKQDYKQEIIEDLDFARKHDFKVLLVDANPEKGFNYSYMVYIPNNPSKTLVMDCLNDYEDKIEPGKTENAAALEQVYSLFGDDRRIKHPITMEETRNEESEAQTLDRVHYRVEKGIRAIQALSVKNVNAPAIVPLIPGYGNESFDNVASQLDRGVAKDIAPQVVAMIEDAKRVIEKDKPEIQLNDKIIAYGHSKSSTFANNFVTLHPEMIQAAIVGGSEEMTLPIDEIALQVVEKDEITDKEQFKIINGKVTKKVTKEELAEIVKEYNNERKDSWKPIVMNQNGTYNLPMNFPLGIADIEDYIDLSQFAGGKEGYMQTLSNIPRMLFVGEKEEEVVGNFAYHDAKTIDGIDIKAGQSVGDLIQSRRNQGQELTEVERASMHNRILEYIAATRTLFGRSANERLNNYMQLCDVLDMPVQSKVYKGVGHVDINASKDLRNDTKLFYEGVIADSIPKLGDEGRVSRINPIYQLMRRYMVSKTLNEYNKKGELLKGISEEELLKRVEAYLSTKTISEDANIDKIYDDLTSRELEEIFLEKNLDKHQIFSEEEIRKSTENTPIQDNENAKARMNKDIKDIRIMKEAAEAPNLED